MDYVDLHVHSNASDGTCTPTEVVGLAARAGLKAIALTDHDTTAGIPEALLAGAACGVEVIPASRSPVLTRAMRSISWDFSSRPETLAWNLS